MAFPEVFSICLSGGFRVFTHPLESVMIKGCYVWLGKPSKANSFSDFGLYTLNFIDWLIENKES